jgi:N-acetylmuramoyl-L-alanine amidase
VSLAAPVRVRRAAWLVPGDLVVRALPVLLGAGVRVAPANAPAARVREPSPPVRVVRPVVASAPRPESRPIPVPAVLTPSLRPAPAATPPAADPGEQPAERPAEPPVAGPDPPRPPTRTAGIELRHRSYPTHTRIVLETEATLEPRVVETATGVTVSFPGVSPRGWNETRTVRDGLVSTVQLAEARGAAALVVGLERPAAARKVYRLEEPPRLVIEFHRQAAPAASPPSAEPIRTVVIDPGHGGQDTGAVGPGGLQEKALTLDVARRLAALLQEDLGVRVVLTRTRDQYVALRERTGFANREKADLFVSIHANAAAAGAATGTETYFLSSEATDGAARRAAEYENRVIALDAGPRGGGKDVLRSILWDLAQSDFQQESSRAAEALQHQLDRALRLPSRGVKQAPFYVLGGAAMPAVLVEIGFITNPQEESRLRDDGYRDRIARALAAGLATYKRGYDQRTGVVARR